MWEHVPDPKIIDPTDVIVQVDITTICGTDLQILKGDVPAVTDWPCAPNCPMSCCNGRISPPRTPCRSWSATAISC